MTPELLIGDERRDKKSRNQIQSSAIRNKFIFFMILSEDE